MRILVPLVLFLAAALPRLLDLGAVTTIDEALWLDRGRGFARGIAAGDLAATIQTEHPGVTTMALVALSLATRRALGGVGAPEEATPLELLVWARLPIALVISLGAPLLYALLRPWVGGAVAVAGTLLVFWDPLFVGLSRVVHLDALLGMFLLLGLVSFGAYLRTGAVHLLVTSSLAAALGILTRLNGLLLLPIGWVLWLASAPAPERRLREALPVLAWSLLAAALVLLLWPALLVAPGRGVEVLAGRTPGYVRQIHAGALYAVAPGYYLEAAGTYLGTPVFAALLGLLLVGGIAWLVRYRAPSDDEGEARKLIAHLVLFAILFLALMTLGGKKAPRYGLPAYLAITLAVAVGVGQVALLGRRAGGALLAVLVVAQLGGTVAAHPRQLAAHNLLWPWKADAGTRWGEGLELAGAALGEFPQEAGVVVSSWYPSVLAQYYGGRIVSPEELPNPQVDYAVAYAYRFGPPAFPADDLSGYYDEVIPERVFYLYGQEYVWILPSPARLERLRAALAAAGELDEVVAVPPSLAQLARRALGPDLVMAPAGRFGSVADELEWLRSQGAELLLQTLPEGFWRLPERGGSHLEPVASYTSLPSLEDLLASVGHEGLHGDRLPVALEDAQGWEELHLAGSGGTVSRDGEVLTISLADPVQETELVVAASQVLAPGLVVDVQLAPGASELADGAAVGLYLLRTDGGGTPRGESVVLGWARREEPPGRGILLLREDESSRERVLEGLPFPDRLRLILYRGSLLGLVGSGEGWQTVGSLDLEGWDHLRLGVGARSWVTQPSLGPGFSDLAVWRTLQPVPKGALLYLLMP